MFLGKDNPDQLVQITKIMGTQELFAYIDKYGMVINKKEHKRLKPYFY